MSQLSFQGKIRLNTAVFNEINNAWECNIHFTDLSGVYSPISIQTSPIGVIPTTGDFILIDTSAFESGTISYFNITSIRNINLENSTFDAVLEYSWFNDNLNVPDLRYSLGYDGVICRILGPRGTLVSPSSSLQGIPESFISSIINYNSIIAENITDPEDRYDICVYEPDKLSLVPPVLFKNMTNSFLTFHLAESNSICKVPASTTETTISVEIDGNEQIQIVYGVDAADAILTAPYLDLAVLLPSSVIEIKVVGTPDPDLAGVSILLSFVIAPNYGE